MANHMDFEQSIDDLIDLQSKEDIYQNLLHCERFTKIGDPILEAIIKSVLERPSSDHHKLEDCKELLVGVRLFRKIQKKDPTILSLGACFSTEKLYVVLDTIKVLIEQCDCDEYYIKSMSSFINVVGSELIKQATCKLDNEEERNFKIRDISIFLEVIKNNWKAISMKISSKSSKNTDTDLNNGGLQTFKTLPCSSSSILSTLVPTLVDGIGNELQNQESSIHEGSRTENISKHPLVSCHQQATSEENQPSTHGNLSRGSVGYIKEESEDASYDRDQDDTEEDKDPPTETGERRENLTADQESVQEYLYGHIMPAYKKTPRKNYCMFCKEMVSNFTRHTLCKHQKIDEVIRYNASQNTVNGKKERKNIIKELRLRSNHMYNKQVIEDTKLGKSPKGLLLYKLSSRVGGSYVMCSLCQGVYCKASAYKHKCFKDFKSQKKNSAFGQHSSGSLKRPVAVPLDVDDNKDDSFEASITCMLRGNSKTEMALNDSLLMSIVRSYGKKWPKRKNCTFQTIYLGCEFLMKLKEKDRTICELFDCLVPSKKDLVFDTVKNMCEYSEITKRFGIKSMPRRLLLLLRAASTEALKDVFLSQSTSEEKKAAVMQSTNEIINFIEEMMMFANSENKKMEDLNDIVCENTNGDQVFVIESQQSKLTESTGSKTHIDGSVIVKNSANEPKSRSSLSSRRVTKNVMKKRTKFEAERLTDLTSSLREKSKKITPPSEESMLLIVKQNVTSPNKKTAFNKNSSERTEVLQLSSEHISPRIVSSNPRHDLDQHLNEDSNDCLLSGSQKTNKPDHQSRKISYQYCEFCNKLVEQFSRHLMRKHKNEEEVIKLKKLSINNKKIYKAELRDLRRRGNHIYNQNLLLNADLQDSNTAKSLLNFKQTKKPYKLEDLLVCKFCKGVIRRRYFYKHHRLCHSRQKHDLQNEKNVYDCGSESTKSFKDQFFNKPKSSESNLSVRKQSNLDNLDIKRGENYCLYCKKIVPKVIQHLLASHRDKKPVIQLQNLSKQTGTESIKRRSKIVKSLLQISKKLYLKHSHAKGIITLGHNFQNPIKTPQEKDKNVSVVKEMVNRSLIVNGSPTISNTIIYPNRDCRTQESTKKEYKSDIKGASDGNTYCMESSVIVNNSANEPKSQTSLNTSQVTKNVIGNSTKFEAERSSDHQTSTLCETFEKLTPSTEESMLSSSEQTCTPSNEKTAFNKNSSERTEVLQLSTEQISTTMVCFNTLHDLDQNLNEDLNNKLDHQSRKIRYQYCEFCNKLVEQFSRHLMRKHKNEEEVIKLKKLSINNKKIYKAELRDLRRRGNHIYNQNLLLNAELQDSNTAKSLLNFKQTKKPYKLEDLLVCKFCKGVIRRRYFYKHHRLCHSRQKHDLQNEKNVYDCGSESTKSFKDQFFNKPKSSESNLSVRKQSNLDNLDIKRGENYCLYCKKIVPKVIQHLLASHRDKKPVIQLQNLSKQTGTESIKRRSKIVKSLLQISKKLYLKHSHAKGIITLSHYFQNPIKTPQEKDENVSAVKEMVNDDNRSLIVKRTPTISTDIINSNKDSRTQENNKDENIPVIKGASDDNTRHIARETSFRTNTPITIKKEMKLNKEIKNMSSEKCLAKKYATPLVTPNLYPQASTKLKEVTISKLRMDKVTKIALNDSLLVATASRIVEKMYNKTKDHGSARVAQFIRDGGKMLMCAQSRDKTISGFRDLLKSSKVDTAFEVAKEMCGIDEKTGFVKFTSLPFRLTYVINQISAQALEEALNDDSLNEYNKKLIENDINKFLELKRTKFRSIITCWPGSKKQEPFQLRKPDEESNYENSESDENVHVIDKGCASTSTHEVGEKIAQGENLSSTFTHNHLPCGTGKTPFRKIRWTEKQKRIVVSEFKDFIVKGTNPGRKRCRELIASCEELQGRTADQVNLIIDNINKGKLKIPSEFEHLKSQPTNC